MLDCWSVNPLLYQYHWSFLALMRLLTASYNFLTQSTVYRPVYKCLNHLNYGRYFRLGEHSSNEISRHHVFRKACDYFQSNFQEISPFFLSALKWREYMLRSQLKLKHDTLVIFSSQCVSGRYSLYPAILLVPRAGSILPLRVESPSASLATLQFFINILVLDEDSFGLTESIETTYTIGTHLV